MATVRKRAAAACNDGMQDVLELVFIGNGQAQVFNGQKRMPATVRF
jgi:hypothetical protein